MASGNGGAQHKISPRKFSEKIALLNKKEKEGNAKFEEIIKEVQATKQQQQQQHLQYQPSAPYGSPYTEPGPSIVEVDESYNEEIEAVYKNLMKTVGQYDQEQLRYQDKQQSSQENVAPQFSDKTSFRSASAGLECDAADLSSIITPITSSLVSSNGTYLNSYVNQQASGLNDDQRCNNNNTTDIDLNDITFIPCEPISNKNISGQNTANLCAAPPYNSPTIQQHNLGQTTGQTRGRVISFGSATNYKYMCTNNAANGQPKYLDQANNWPTSYNQNYLDEPSCDRSRQKSCSDPALHVLPPTDVISGQNVVQPNQHFNQHQYESLGASGGGGTGADVPGIQICAIDDDTNLARVTMTNCQPIASETLDHSSRDSSLPDISNLQFDNNSAKATPERSRIVNSSLLQQQHHHHNQQLDSSASCYDLGNNQFDMNRSLATETFPDSCQALDGSWTSTRYQQIDDTMDSLDQQIEILGGGQQQHQHNQLGQYQDDMGYTLPTTFSNQMDGPKVSNLLSNSDCGLTTSGQHHPHGSLMICTSSDLYSNIIRSRSHSNIDYLAKQQQNNLNQQHTIVNNRHVLQQANQTGLGATMSVVNSKRVEDLKAHESSVSPLGSSSNLNSPQSDMNSPASSTNEYCDLAANNCGAGNNSGRLIYSQQAAGFHQQPEFCQQANTGCTGNENVSNREFGGGGPYIVPQQQQHQQQQQQQQQQHALDNQSAQVQAQNSMALNNQVIFKASF